MQDHPYPPEALLALTSELAHKYVGCDSTSLSYEKAQSLFEAVLYHLDAYARWSTEGLAPTDLSAKAAYQAGFQLVLEKMQQLVTIYEKLLSDFNDYDLICLRDTVRRALPEFLRRYDVRFCPQETLLTLDYPTLAPFYGLEGVDKVYQYTLAIDYEQRFLRRFPSAYVTSTLRAYHPQYQNLVENITVIVLQNTIGHLLLAKPLTTGGFDAVETRQLTERLSSLTLAAVEELIRQGISSLCTDDDVCWYLQHIAADMAARLHLNACKGSLTHCFVW